MDPTNPEQIAVDPNAAQNQETLDKSNVQKRIDELTALRTAAEKRAESMEAQVAQLTQLVAQQMERQHAQPVVPQQEQLPEGVDPSLAKFFLDKFAKLQQESEVRTQNLFWQVQNQMDQTQVASKFGKLPPEVLQDAANRLTGLKRQYGERANMEDAVALAHWHYLQKHGNSAAAQAFNQMNQPLSIHGQPIQPAQSTNLASPASMPNWDNLDYATQNRLIDEWEKKGGKLNII